MSDLRQRIEAWSANNIELESVGWVNVWVAGGGMMVDAVREWQTRHGLDDVQAHQISVDLLSTTARLFHNLFSDWHLVIDINQLVAKQFVNPEFPGCANVVFDCSDWAKADRRLKADWETTSDSISLRLAIELGALELHLLKSASPSSPDIEESIADGLIDPSFADHLRDGSGISVKVSNLRNISESVKMKMNSHK